MKTSAGTLRTTAYLLLVLLISAGLAACGGGGGGSTPGTSGPATVRVSIASAPSFPAGTTFAASTSSPTIAAPPEDSPTFEHLDVRVTKLALIPSTGEDKSVTDPLVPPIQIDLLDLSGDNVATLLNQFSGVPAGEYSKIRVYYDNVVGRSGNDNTLFHPTANSHFDVHFMGGNLVIPVTTDPGGGIRFYSVLINVVDGLKHHEAGQSGNVLLRPQVFATVVEAPKYIVTGFADNVAKDNYDGLFDILTLGGRSIPAAFSDGGTSWAYSDNVLEDSTWIIVRGKEIAVPAFNKGAIVSAIGSFDTEGRLQASQITFSFPDVREGKSDNVWIQNNTAFIVRSTDNVTVFPKPAREFAYYDNLAVPHDTLAFTNLDNNLLVRVRGYFEDPEAPNLVLESYWISIDGPYVGP